jgi:hypothetical protein
MNKLVHIYFRNLNQDKTFQEKIKHIRKVKGVKGLKILLKEVASAGKHDNKFIGSVSIPLKVWLLINNCPLITERLQYDLKINPNFQNITLTFIGQKHF